MHGITLERLRREPLFGEVAPELLDFLGDAELVIHNAAFDVGFLNAELRRLPGGLPAIDGTRRVLDTLTLARELHPGQRNSLDALCKRYGIDNSKRELHGALLDARILADVYLAMTGGQSALALGESRRARVERSEERRWARASTAPLTVITPTATELAGHERLLERVRKASKQGAVSW